MEQPIIALFSPKMDFVFKVLFGDERNKDILLGLLNAVWKHPEGKELTDVRILNPSFVKDWFLQKDGHLDLLAEDTDGNVFHIELQCASHTMFVERGVYYWSRLYGNQLQEGEDYTQLHPVISIMFVDFKIFTDTEQWHSCYKWRDEEGRVLTNHAEIHFIEMPKVTGRVPKKEAALARWVKFLREGETMTPQAIQRLNDPRIQRAYEELERLSRDPNMRAYYEERLIGLKDYLTDINQQFSKGKLEGKEEVARNLRAMGWDEAQIANVVGVSVEEVCAWLHPSEPAPQTEKAHSRSRTKKRNS